MRIVRNQESLSSSVVFHILLVALDVSTRKQEVREKEREIIDLAPDHCSHLDMVPGLRSVPQYHSVLVTMDMGHDATPCVRWGYMSPRRSAALESFDMMYLQF